jgi:hypothetical protein
MKSLSSFVSFTVVFGLIIAAPALSQEAATQEQAGSSTRPVSQAAPKPAAPSQTPAADTAGDVATEPPGGKRVFGVLPNYRTADASQEGTVLTPRQKLAIASKDSFDYPLILLGGVYAGLTQLAKVDPSFGQGPKGYGHRLLTNSSDQALGNIFTEGLLPVMLHEDPRYFRLGTGANRHRTTYSLTRVFVTHKDAGGASFNFSEWLGNATAVAISNAYYPDDRTLKANGTKLLEQVGTDALGQVLKEFWPDIKNKLFHK